MSVIELKGLTDEMFRAALTPYDAVDCLRACANNGWKTFNVNAWRRQFGKSKTSGKSAGQQQYENGMAALEGI